MAKLFLKTPSVYILILGLFLLTVTESKSGILSSPDFISGKVVYSDDNSPVTGGNVNILSPDKDAGTFSIIGTVSIEPDGSFKVGRKIILQTDDIKIMAYPNDVDNNESQFEPKTIEVRNSEIMENDNFELLIVVDRVNSVKHESQGNLQREKVNLKQNFPNPFNPTTLISFELPESNNVTLKVFNMKGETVAVLAENQILKKGLNEMEFNAGNLPSGMYVYTLKSGNISQNRKMLLLK
ncbi:MAG: T9SS type A sorting domain-containing protein [Bacteroidetes bacterium]|nr:T9SS type A sorting domain-containing protein [Bacteroidota bacterium]